MSKRAITIELTAAERSALQDLAKRRRTAQGLVRRARIVLAAAEGKDNKAIAQEIGGDKKTVGKWRFAVHRVDGLHDEPTQRRIGDEEIAETVRLTLETTPPGATHWSLRALAGQPRAFDNPSHLASLLPTAAPHRDFQALNRSAVCREGARHRRDLHGSARARHGALRRREELDPSARSHPTVAADAPRPGRTAHPRL